MYIRTIYNNISSYVTNAGFLSEKFKLTRGVRQGCPLSPYLFILCVENPANTIRQNKNIEGIRIGTTELKISQLADDTVCYVKNMNSLTTLIETFENFEKNIRLKIK